MAVAGPVDPELVFEIAAAGGLAAGQAPRCLFPDDLGAVATDRCDVTVGLARPRLRLGFKDRELVKSPQRRLRRDLVSRILLDQLFGGASEVREQLHRDGVVDDSLSFAYTGERSFGFAVVGCEADNPDLVGAALRAALVRPIEFDEQDLERVRRKLLGQYVRSFDSIRSMAFSHGEEALDDLEPFEMMARVRSIEVDEVRARQQELFRDDAFAMAVVD